MRANGIRNGNLVAEALAKPGDRLHGSARHPTLPDWRWRLFDGGVINLPRPGSRRTSLMQLSRLPTGPIAVLAIIAIWTDRLLRRPASLGVDSLIHPSPTGVDGVRRRKPAASIKGLQLEGVLPGITINTSATDFAPIKQFQLKGERWELFGDVITTEVGE
jgi:hypothetical protein